MTAALFPPSSSACYCSIPVDSASKSLRAITRQVPRTIGDCELTHLARETIDPERARSQHRNYVALLERLGCAIDELPEAPGLADSVFVEDTALVLDEVAVVLRPGAPSRRGETVTIARALARYREVRSVAAPGTIDGGDVLRIGRQLFVGRTPRTSGAGVAALAAIVAGHGYSVHEVEVHGCLHLKSAATEVDDGLLLVNRAWLDLGSFDGFHLLEVDPREPFAANALRLNGRLIFSHAHGRTAERLLALGLRLELVDLSELAKAEAGVTCCSLVFPE